MNDLWSAAGAEWHGRGQAFKKAGWLPTTARVLWGKVYREPWCLVSNCPDLDSWTYAKRCWHEGGFRDLKSDGWQWQVSHIFSADHANRLLLVLAIACGYVLTLGRFAFDDQALRRLVSKGTRQTYSRFRLGFRLVERFFVNTLDFCCSFLCFIDGPSARPKTVGA